MFLGLNYITPATITHEERVFKSETLSLRIQTNVSSASRWRVQLGLEPSRENGSAGALQVHRAQFGVHTPFNMLMPQHLGTDPTVESNTIVSVSGVHAASDSTIMVDSNTSFTIPAGRFITFAGHNKVYITTSALNYTSGTTGTLNIFPALHSGLVDNAIVNLNPNISVRYSSEESVSITITDGRTVEETMDVTEAI